MTPCFTILVVLRLGSTHNKSVMRVAYPRLVRNSQQQNTGISIIRNTRIFLVSATFWFDDYTEIPKMAGVKREGLVRWGGSAPALSVRDDRRRR